MYLYILNYASKMYLNSMQVLLIKWWLLIIFLILTLKIES